MKGEMHGSSASQRSPTGVGGRAGLPILSLLVPASLALERELSYRVIATVDVVQAVAS
jgi:hypothetical protein